MGFSRLKRLTRHFKHYDKKDDEGNSLLSESASLSPESTIINADASSKDSKNTPRGPPEPKDDDYKLKATAETVSLWSRAYTKLRESDPELIQKFEELAAYELKETDVGNDKGGQETLDPHGTGQAKMARLITLGLERTAAVAKAKAGAKSAVDFVLHFKDAIDSAMQASPAPAAVWTGVSLGLNLFLEPLKATETNREGIVYVVARIKWYDSLCSLLLRENTTMGTPNFGSLRYSLEEKLLGLYEDIIKFTALSVLSYYRNQGLQFLRDFAGMDGLDSSLQAIKDEEELVRKDIEQFGSQAIQSYLSSLVAAADSQQRELSSHLVNIETAIERQTAAQERWHVEEGDDDCLKDLWWTSPEIEMQAIGSRKDELIDEAYDWILETEAYQSMLDWDAESHAEPERRLLWIRGDAGTGKTMTTMGIVRDLASAMQRHQDAVLSYFFVQATDDRLNDATAILRSLVWYLAKQKRHLVKYLREHHKTAKAIFSGKNAFFLLSEILQNMAQDEALSRVILLVDAMDECQETGLKDLMGTVCKVLENCPRVRIVLSSRPQNACIESSLQRVASLMATLQLSPKLLAQPVEVYIQQRTSLLMPRFQPETVEHIAYQLRLKAGGTFLWVALVCKELEDVDEYDAEDAVKEMPEGLKQLYERMFQKIATLKRRDPEFCKSVLETITVAFRPLALAELGTLAGLPPNVPALTIAKKCGTFLTVRDDTVYLIHQSAKDYLHDDIYHGKLGEMNTTVLQRCLEGMKSTLTRNIYGLKSLGTLTAEITAPIPDPLDPVRYCCLHWADHLCEAGEVSQFPAELVQSFLRTKFLNWIESLTLLNAFPSAMNSNMKLRTFSKERTPSDKFLIDFTVDAERFLMFNREGIELAPLQVYTSALIFTPSGSLLRQLFQDEAPTWVSVAPVEQDWDPYLGSINSLLTGQLIGAVVSADGRLTCRTSETGSDGEQHTERIEILESDLSTVAFKVEVDGPAGYYSERHMALLPGGDLVLCHYENIYFYDSKGKLMRELRYEAWVEALAVSPGGDIVIHLEDGTIRVVSAYFQEKAVLHGGTADDMAACFVMLPDGCIISGTANGTLYFWNHPGYLQGTSPARYEVFDAEDKSQWSPSDQDVGDEARSPVELKEPEDPESGTTTRSDKYSLELASSPKGWIASLMKSRRMAAPHIIKLWRAGVKPPRGVECTATIILQDSNIWSMAFLSDDRLVAYVTSNSTQSSALHFWNTSGDLVGYYEASSTINSRRLIPLRGESPRLLVGTHLIDAGLVHVPQVAEHATSLDVYQRMWISTNGTTVVSHMSGWETEDTHIWDVTGRLPALRRILKGVACDCEGRTVTNVLPSNDGTRMAVTSHQDLKHISVRLWDTVSGEQIPLPALEESYPDHPPFGIAFTWDSSTVVWVSGPQENTKKLSCFKVNLANLGDGTVRTLDCSIDGFGGDITEIAEVALSPDARTLAVAVAEGEAGPYGLPNSATLKGVELVDLATGERLKLPKVDDINPADLGRKQMVWSPDGRFLLIRYGLSLGSLESREQVTIWEVGGGDKTKSWTFEIGKGSPAELPFNIFANQADTYCESIFGFHILEALQGTPDHPKYEFGTDNDARYDSLWLKRNGERMIFIPQKYSRAHSPGVSIRPNVCGEEGKLFLAPNGGGLIIWSFSAVGRGEDTSTN